MTAVATLVLICVGGLVTSHGVGLAVPDWPTTYGYNPFFFPFSKWVGGFFTSIATGWWLPRWDSSP
jgi:cytochrome c oxidase assembly protein subunit 15